MDVSVYLSFLSVRVSYILNNPLSNFWTEILAVILSVLVEFVQVKKYMEHLSLNNKYLSFLGKW